MPRLLLVDDINTNLYVLEAILLSEGYEMEMVTTGEAALASIASERFDLVLLDIMMPGINGLEVCRQLKTNSRTRHIPILMVTALDSKQDLSDALEAGADDFISKPVDALEVRARVRSLLRIKQQYDELCQTLELQRNLLQMREDMSNMLVHDFRNPLQSIILSCELLNSSDLSPYQARYTSRIMDAYTRLGSMIDDMLIVAKLEAGQLVPQIDSLPMQKTIQSSLDGFQVLAQRKRIELKHELPEVMIYIPGDPKLIRRLLDNLLSNAIKYSPPDSSVLVRLKQQIGCCEVEIIDQGIGIRPELHQCIFEKYETGQVVQDVTQIGLGLSFCKMVTDVHSGTLSVMENQPQGSIFALQLPMLGAVLTEAG